MGELRESSAAGAAFLVGVGAALVAGLPVGSRAAHGAAVAWIADRDGGRAVAVDASLREVAAAAVPAPVGVVACADGGAWVLSAEEGWAGGRLGLRRLDGAGRVALGPSAATHADLERLDGGPDELELPAPLLPPELLELGVERWTALPGGGRLAVGPGALLLVDGRGRIRASRGGYGRIADVDVRPP